MSDNQDRDNYDDNTTIPLTVEEQRRVYDLYGQRIAEHKTLMHDVRDRADADAFYLIMTVECEQHSRLWLLWRWFVQRLAVLHGRF